MNVPNVTMQERQNFSNLRARLGSGGSPIEIKGVNGNVRFESDAPAAAATTTSANATSSSVPAGAAPPPPPPPPSH